MSSVYISLQQQEPVFHQVNEFVKELGLDVTGSDFNRPWGGFLVIDESQALRFISIFFPELSVEDFQGFGRLSPKFLIVAPHKRLSWQYHHRRAELWKLIGGEAGVVVSESDEEGELHILATGETVNLRQGQRHRLVGLEQWGVVAEIWKHTHPEFPSDEADIVRLQDDFGRGGG